MFLKDKDIDNNSSIIKKEFFLFTLITVLLAFLYIKNKILLDNIKETTILNQVGDILVISAFIMLEIVALSKFIILHFFKKESYFINKKIELIVKNISILLSIIGIVLIFINDFL